MKKVFIFILFLLTVSLSGQIIPGVTASAGSAVTPSTLLTGLVSYWTLDEASGAAIDSKALTNLAVYNATQNQAGFNGSSTAYTFNGTTSYLGNIDATYEIPVSFTVSAWVKTTTTGVYKFAVSNYHDPDGWCLGMTDNGTLDFEVNTGYVMSVAAINTGSWVHIVGVWNGTNVICFQNGVKATGSAQATVTYDVNSRFQVGSRESASFWNGSIDEVAIWSRALTDGEVALLYNGGTGRIYPF